MEGLDPQQNPHMEGLDPQQGPIIEQGLVPQQDPSMEGLDPQQGSSMEQEIDPEQGPTVEQGLEPQQGPAMEGLDPQQGTTIEGMDSQQGTTIEELDPQQGPTIERLEPQQASNMEGLDPQQGPIMEGLDSQQGPLYSITMTDRGHLDPKTVIVSEGSAVSKGLGSQMYIIQSSDLSSQPSQESDLDPSTFVLRPDPVSTVTTVSLGEEGSGQGVGEALTAVVDFVKPEEGSGSALYQGLRDDEPGDMATEAGLGAEDQGETITISLEEATQIILQQQGLEGAAIRMPDGSYQLLGQQFIQVTKEDGTVETQPLSLEVVQALSGGMVGLANVTQDDQQLPTTQIELGESHEANAVCSVSEAKVAVDDTASGGVAKDSQTVVKEERQEYKVSVEPALPAQEQVERQVPSLTVSVSATGSTTATLETPTQPVVKKEDVKPDLNSPIEVTERTEIMIRGKKCVLMQNPETKQLCAYPILPPEGKKRRGRPRKVKPDKLEEESVAVTPSASKTPVSGTPLSVANAAVTDTTSVSEAGGSDMTPTASAGTSVNLGDQNSAAEGLLELSNAGPDSVRRSARKRKKAKVFEDYDILEASSEEENFNDDEKDPDVTMYGVKRQKVKKEPPPVVTGTPFMMPVKRGRGRPRRYPPPGQSSAMSSIPAVILPTSNGQTLVMAPLQNMAGLGSQMKTQFQQLVPKPSGGSGGESVLQPPISTAAIPLGPDGDALPMDPTAVLDANGLLASGLPGESLPLVGESDTQESLDTVGEKERGEGEGSEGQQHTVIQIPENLLPMFGIKKDPIKIGLKASESELEKLKCPKCDFQGYYLQQYQNHIATHSGDIHKCKCCNYLTFSKDELLEHFKANHPRCICEVCEFMAEHAYMIKRHMMRHNAEGCTCESCGKTYKDQYILKMHVKMVHMPAEVLFECTVCGKKFTRKAHLKRHLRIHDPQKPFKCPHCDYRGCERSDISKHQLIHEEPKHICEICNKGFRHIKNKELHVKRHNGQRDYKCGVCDFYGYTFTDIRKHIERKHSDIKQVVCDKCATPFKTEQQLREHLKENCEVLMIEQALAIATSSGGTSQATIQIPSTFAVDAQHITIAQGQQVAVDGSQVNITVQHVSEEDVSLEEDQMVETTIADIVTSSGHVIDNSDGTIHIIPTDGMETEESDLPPETMIHLE